MKQVIITDVDGVITSWQSGLVFFLRERGWNADHVLKMIMDEEYQSISEIFDTASGQIHTEQELSELMHEYNNSDYIRHLPAYEDALRQINDMGDDYIFVAVSALSYSDAAFSNRVFNLECLFPSVFEEVILTDVFGSKYDAFKTIIESYGSQNILCYIDDLEHNLDAFRDAYEYHIDGVQLQDRPWIILMDRRLSQKCTPSVNADVTYKTNWFDIERTIRYGRT